jgi:hypothetical protein
MTAATDHEDAVRAALARRATTFDPPVPPLADLPARRPHPHPRRQVWLAAAAALVLLAGAVAVLVAGRDDDALGPDARTGPAAALPEPPADAVWPLADDVQPAALAGPVRAARAYLAAMRVGPGPVAVRLTDAPPHGRATVAYGTRPGGTVSLRRVHRTWFVTASTSPAITITPATRVDPGHVELGIRLRPGALGGGTVGLVDDAGTIVDLVTVTPAPTQNASTRVLVSPQTGPGRAGEPRARLPLLPRPYVLPCTCRLRVPTGTTPAAVVVNVLDLGAGGSVAAVPVPVSPR